MFFFFIYLDRILCGLIQKRLKTFFDLHISVEYSKNHHAFCVRFRWKSDMIISKQLIIVVYFTDAVLTNSYYKQAQIICINGYKFTKHYIVGSRIRWRCTNYKRACSASFFTFGDMNMVQKRIKHNHPPPAIL